MQRRLLLVLSLIFLLAPSLRADEFKFPVKSNSVRFAAIGDMGTGQTAQYEVAQQMAEAHQHFSFDFVITLGDNIYGGSRPRDFEKKFEVPYKPLLDAGVKFYAALGNHDNTNERFYKLFNMNGANYYTYKKGNVHFFVLDSDYMDPKQLAWLETQLQNAGNGDWKICYFHHPLYSSGRTHGPATDLRLLLEPLFIKYGVDIVFAGHEHVYERIQPQKGIYYFTEGASGELRYGNLRRSEITVKGFDTDLTFILVEIAGDEMYFQTVSRAGATVDSGVIRRPVRVKAAAAHATAHSRSVPPRMIRVRVRNFPGTPPSVAQDAAELPSTVANGDWSEARTMAPVLREDALLTRWRLIG